MAGTRERLLDAALAAFAVNGVEGTPVTELEQRAGLAPGSGGFYRYFRTKDEVLEAAVRREVARVRERRGPTAPADEGGGDDISGGDARTNLRRDFEAALDTLHTVRPLIAILARERDRIPELATEIAEELVTGGVRHEQSLLATDDTHTRTATDALGSVAISALVGYHLATDYFGSPPAGVGRDEFVDTLVELFSPRSA
ncbi:MAG: TetR family transcriptional regulator [Acidimicrobiales bacterium]